MAAVRPRIGLRGVEGPGSCQPYFLRSQTQPYLEIIIVIIDVLLWLGCTGKIQEVG